MKPISKDHPNETRLLAYLDSPQSEELKDNSNSGDTILNYDIWVTPGPLIKYGVPGITRKRTAGLISAAPLALTVSASFPYNPSSKRLYAAHTNTGQTREQI